MTTPAKQTKQEEGEEELFGDGMEETEEPDGEVEDEDLKEEDKHKKIKSVFTSA